MLEWLRHQRHITQELRKKMSPYDEKMFVTSVETLMCMLSLYSSIVALAIRTATVAVAKTMLPDLSEDEVSQIFVVSRCQRDDIPSASAVVFTAQEHHGDDSSRHSRSIRKGHLPD